MAAVVSATGIVLEASSGETASGALLARLGADSTAASRPASDASNCGVAVSSPLRRLARGSRIAAARAATQTAFRWFAGPLRMNRQASAATAAATGTCQSELSKKVTRDRLIVSMLFLPRALQQLLN